MELIYLFLAVGLFAVGAGIWGFLNNRKSRHQQEIAANQAV
jgi:nitric oxide reductase large subunit